MQGKEQAVGYRKKVLVAALAAAAVASVMSLVGCNTTEGAGKDIESLGEGIKDAASDAKD